MSTQRVCGGRSCGWGFSSVLAPPLEQGLAPQWSCGGGAKGGLQVAERHVSPVEALAWQRAA